MSEIQKQIQSPKGIFMICLIGFPMVSRCSGGRTFNFSSFKPPVCLFSISICYSCIVSIAAVLIITAPCDLPLACNHPQVQDVCRSCCSQSITEVELSHRRQVSQKLGDEEVKAPTGFTMAFGVEGGLGVLASYTQTAA